MYLIDQNKKAIMENCKLKAREKGLEFSEESLEYITTNRDMNELSPKIMIPTLYDYWVHDVNVIRGNAVYDVFPNNPYETVINTRPPISFYNDNNHDWLDCMIYYHVLGHIDFFQNNHFFEKTWDDDFIGKSLSDKRRINEIRENLGSDKRWVDYTIEFARGIDNLVGFHSNLRSSNVKLSKPKNTKLEYYFGEFLREKKDLKISEFYRDVKRHKDLVEEYGSEKGDRYFISEIKEKYPEFENLYEKEINNINEPVTDLMEYILKNANYMNQEKYKWMKEVIRIVRETSLYFYPQILTKIMNEGWASYWHQHLFEKDPKMEGHLVDYAKVNARVLQIPKIGMNPYAIGYHLFEHIYELANSGKLSKEFEKINDINERKEYNTNTNKGMEVLFQMRKYFDDITFINFLDKKNFQDFVDKHNLFVSDNRFSWNTFNWEHFIKSRNGEDYRRMLKASTYHPPYIKINNKEEGSKVLQLEHVFEGKPLISKYIPNVLIGIEYLWGGPVILDTVEFDFKDETSLIEYLMGQREAKDCLVRKNVRYRCDNRKVAKSQRGYYDHR